MNGSQKSPLVGGLLKRLMLGGDVYNARTLPRLYILHVAILPATVIGLLLVHIALIRLHGISRLAFEEETEEEAGSFDFFPDHVYSELIVGTLLMIVLSALATAQPAALGDPADPLTTPEVIKPEWFFYATFRWLKLFSGTFAVLSTGFVVGALIVWPWIDAAIRRRTRWQEAGTCVGVIAVLTIIAMTVWEAAVKH